VVVTKGRRLTPAKPAAWHEARDPLAADVEALRRQLGVNPG